jgi:hypothetical protein
MERIGVRPELVVEPGRIYEYKVVLVGIKVISSNV